MPGILKKLKNVAHEHTTYRVGLMQTRAYRVLKRHSNASLAVHNITSVHWALLGLLFDTPSGMRLSQAATELGVEAPFLSVLADELTRHGYTSISKDGSDTRAKVLKLSSTGSDFVRKIEKKMRDSMRHLVAGCRIGDLATYVRVLSSIIENDNSLQKN